MFKALVIAYYFPPMGLSGVQRTLKFCKYMSDFNWKPTVITGSGSSYFAYDMSLLYEAINNNIEIVRTDPFDPNSILKKRSGFVKGKEALKNSIGKLTKNIFIPDNKIFWTNKAYNSAKKLLTENHFDVIYVSAPPFSSIVLGARLKREFNIPLFVDYRNLWQQKETKKNLSPYHKIKNKKLEDNSLRITDKVIVANRKIKEKLLTDYPFFTFDDILIIPNGYDDEDFNNLPIIPRQNNKMKITYSGIFNELISPKYFLEAFKKLTIERPDIAADIELHFLGALRTANRKIVKKLNLQKYVFDRGALDHKDSLVEIFNSDILWMMVDNIKESYTVSGGKLYEYFGTKKPIIACVPEGAAQIAAEEYAASFIVPPDNIEKIKETILKAYLLFKENNLPKPNLEFIQGLNRKNLTEILTKEFQFFIKEDVI